MKFAEIIKSNVWLSVEIILLRLYPDEKNNISDYESVFNDLKCMIPTETEISIVVSRETDDFDNHEYINVSGYYNNPKDNDNELTNSLAIEFTSWDKWLGMDIDTKTLKDFTELEIISHCLFEMTFVSFEQDEIQEKMNKINGMADEIKNMTEEEKKEKLKSWDDLKKEWEKDDKNEE
jgi:hypothetical protein